LSESVASLGERRRLSGRHVEIVIDVPHPVGSGILIEWVRDPCFVFRFREECVFHVSVCWECQGRRPEVSAGLDPWRG